MNYHPLASGGGVFDSGQSSCDSGVLDKPGKKGTVWWHTPAVSSHGKTMAVDREVVARRGDSRNMSVEASCARWRCSDDGDGQNGGSAVRWAVVGD